MAEINYSWVKTHQEIVEYLKNKENNQLELIELLKNVGITVFGDEESKGIKTELTEIDPFTFFCHIYKHGNENNLKFLQKISEILKISIPTDDYGIPTSNAQKVWLFPWKYLRTNNEIARLWKFFKIALDKDLTNEVFADILKIHNVGKAKLTEALFYILPNDFLPLNRPIKLYLKEYYNVDSNFDNYLEYLEILKKVKQKSISPFYEISYEAFIYKPKSAESMTQYWICSPGQNAEKWEEFYENGIIGLGFGELGDLNNYNSKQEILNKYQVINNNESIKGNDSSANYDFKENIQIGDVIFVKKGRKGLLGYGIIESDYYYDEERPNYNKCRKVSWKKKGEWPIDQSMPLKTLTNISKQKANDGIHEYYFEKLFDIIGNMTEKNISKVEINYPLNTILYGPPGTGKTYNTVNKALEIIGEDLKNLSRAKIKATFDNYVAAGQIVFTTFHQSMNYEDFIEGIKPILGDDENDNVKYEIQDGIFMQLAKEAYKEYLYLNQKKNSQTNVITFSNAWQYLIDDATNGIESGNLFKLPTLTGKEFNVISVSNKGNLITKPNIETDQIYTVSYERTKKLFESFPELSKVKNIDKEFRAVIGGSNSSSYWSALNYIIEKTKKGKISNENLESEVIPNNQIRFDNQIVTENIKESVKPYILIIDEINRGNVSQIFGELITLIEEDKRLGKDEALTLTLPYSKEKFGVPPNLYIIGTMNTADRSVEALDTALRRRFSFEEMLPDASNITKYGSLSASNGQLEDLDLPLLLDTLNKRIEKLLDKEHQIGHSFFMPISNIEQLKMAFQNKIIPLLQEYFFGDTGKIGLIVGKDFFETIENTNENIFAEFGEIDGSEYLERTIYKFKNVSKMTNEEFKLAINKLLKK